MPGARLFFEMKGFPIALPDLNYVVMGEGISEFTAVERSIVALLGRWKNSLFLNGELIAFNLWLLEYPPSVERATPEPFLESIWCAVAVPIREAWVIEFVEWDVARLNESRIAGFDFYCIFECLSIR